MIYEQTFTAMAIADFRPTGVIIIDRIKSPIRGYNMNVEDEIVVSALLLSR